MHLMYKGKTVAPGEHISSVREIRRKEEIIRHDKT